MGTSMAFMLVTLALVSLQCFGDEIEDRIYNGMDAAPGQFPYQAILFSYTYANDTYGEYCGGSLISKRYVLTAAHCVDGTDATTVYLGVTYTQEMSTTDNSYTVDHSTNVIQHEDYNNETSENDIALIELPQEVKLTSYIRTISLPKLAWADPNTFNNYIVTASGFGQTFNNDTAVPHKVLQFTNIHKMPQADCRKAMGNLMVTDGMICTDKKVDSGVCPGDSGGPLTVRYRKRLYVIGIADWIIPPCMNKYPGVFTNVAHYLEWINDNTDIPIS